MRLIDAEALKKDLTRFYDNEVTAKQLIDEQPTIMQIVKPQEPKTGHWIRMKAYEKWGCSECNTVFRFQFKEHDYCPNCGCRMVEPKESEG